MPTQNLAYYLSLPYTIEILPIPEEAGAGYTACIPRLGRYSAVGDGETPEGAYADLRAALPSLIADWLAQGVAIPGPDISQLTGNLAAYHHNTGTGSRPAVRALIEGGFQ